MTPLPPTGELEKPVWGSRSCRQTNRASFANASRAWAAASGEKSALVCTCPVRLDCAPLQKWQAKKGNVEVNQARQRDDADAFDDLLGQLVDELAMTPTLPPEPEPPPVEASPYAYAHYGAGGTAAEAAGAAVATEPLPPPRSNAMAMGLGIGGGIVVLGVIAIFALRPSEDDKKANQASVPAVTRDAPPPPPAPGATPPIATLPNQPGMMPGQPGQMMPGQPGQMMPGQPGQMMPGQPGMTPGQPTAAASTSKPSSGKKRSGSKKKKSSKPASSGGGGSKPKTVDPFG